MMRFTRHLLPLAVLTLSGAMALQAQEPDTGGTNELTDAEMLSRLSELLQAAASGQTEDIAPSSTATVPSATPQVTPQPSSRDHANRFSRNDSSSRSNSSNSQDSSRSSRSRRSRFSRNNSSGSPGPSRDYSRSNDRTPSDSFSGTNTGPASLDYAAFRIIVERNIFDPNRYPRRSGPPPRQAAHVDSLTLVGTMSYDKGTFAFFDGTSSDYKKALKQTDRIAGYKVADITPTSVTLASGTNELQLGVGMQLRREEGGPWLLAGQSQTYTPAPSSTTSTNSAGTSSDSASSAEQSDVIKRLMQRRSQD